MFLFFIFSISAFSCEWWEFPVKETNVKSYVTKGFSVRKHPRKGHCREKWKHSKRLITKFKKAKPNNWPRDEIFKSWTFEEMSKVLETFESVPEILRIFDVSFHRANLSSKKLNPSSFDLSTRSIVFYDEAFTSNKLRNVLNHELSHFLFDTWSESEILEFTKISNWIYIEEVIDGKKVLTKVAPQKKCKSDSHVSSHEHFANCVEIYFKDSAQLKNQDPKMYELLDKRLRK